MKSGLPIDVKFLLEPGRVEGVRVEFKAKWDQYSAIQCLHTACAFANDISNVNGGYIVIGVEEADGHAVRPARGVPPGELDDVQKSIHNVLNWIQPKISTLIAVEVLDGVSVIVIRCPASDERPHLAPEKPEKNSARHTWIRSGSITCKADVAQQRQLMELQGRTPFDDRACHNATLDDVSPALLLHHLQQVGSRHVTQRPEMASLLRSLRLSVRTNGHEVPRNIALLFFHEEPTRWFPGAKIEVAELPKGAAGKKLIERTFSGPLPAQLTAALGHLRNIIPQVVQKSADRAEAERTWAWPFDAVEEALVNAVHHRGYDEPDPVKVELFPTRLRISSYPGPLGGVTMEALASGDLPSIRSRNRRIAELLKEVGLAEARGTGVALIHDAMAKNGSPPPEFRFDDGRTYFEVVLPIHPAFLDQVDSQPLRLGRPAPTAEVVGRESLVERLLRVLESQSIVLVGPPGRGVSSVANALVAKLRHSRDVFELDLSGVGVDGLGAALDSWFEERAHVSEEDAQGSAPTQQSDSLGARLGAHMSEFARRGWVMVLDGLDRIESEHSTGLDDLHRALDIVTSDSHARLIVTTSRIDALQVREGSASWVERARLVAVPPLTRDATEHWMRRLLRGLRAEAAPGTAEALAEVSEGIPGVAVHVLQQLYVDGDLSPDGVHRAFDHVLVEPGDPTRLRERIRRLDVGSRPARRWTRAQRAVLAVLQGESDGRRRLDLVALLETRGTPRLEVLEALRLLELDGIVADVDGALRFEHRLVRGAFREAPEASIDDDVPF